jgi:hypothetical protein
MVCRQKNPFQIASLEIFLSNRDPNVCVLDRPSTNDRLAFMVYDLKRLSFLVRHHSLGIPRLSQISILPGSASAGFGSLDIGTCNAVVGKLERCNTVLLFGPRPGLAIQPVGWEAGPT